ncbi:MAG TPA: hypothetical protein VF147_14195 [Vicinamibacterales bacterium]
MAAAAMNPAVAARQDEIRVIRAIRGKKDKRLSPGPARSLSPG